MSCPTTFDASAFLADRFGSPQRLIALLSAYGLGAPQLAAVVKWRQRNQIPGEWLPVLLYVAELDDGAPVSLGAYLRRREGHDAA